jgi:hypothetical protein
MVVGVVMAVAATFSASAVADAAQPTPTLTSTSTSASGHRCHHGPCPYVMRVGATLVVYADAPVYVWHDLPTSSNPKVVALQSYTTTTATFVAVHKGTSTISIGVEDPACWPNNCGPGPPPPSPPTYSFTVIVKG